MQALGTCAGRQRPSLAWLQRAVAGHLTCAQLRGVAQREGRLTERLLRGCRMVRAFHVRPGTRVSSPTHWGRVLCAPPSCKRVAA